MLKLIFQNLRHCFVNFSFIGLFNLNKNVFKIEKYLFSHRKGIGIFGPLTLPQFYYNFQGILECVETSQVTILEEIGEKFLHVFILDIFKGGLKTDKFVTKCHVQEKCVKCLKLILIVGMIFNSKIVGDNRLNFIYLQCFSSR